MPGDKALDEYLGAVRFENGLNLVLQIIRKTVSNSVFKLVKSQLFGDKNILQIKYLMLSLSDSVKIDVLMIYGAVDPNRMIMDLDFV